MKPAVAICLWSALCVSAAVSCSYDLEKLRAERPGQDAGGMAQMLSDAADPDDISDAASYENMGGTGGDVATGGMSGSSGGMAGSGMSGGMGGNAPCSSLPEVCNNRDDNCDGLIDNGAACPPSTIRDGWIYFFGTQLLSWNDARAWCQSLGRDAVILNDKAEHTWFAEEASAHSRTCRWLGLTDAAAEGQWVWINGTPMEFSYWGPEQPNNAGPNGEHCVALIPLAYLGRPSTWSDLVCNGTDAVTQCLAACRGRMP